MSAQRSPLYSLFGSLSSLRGKLTLVVIVTTAVALLTMTVALLHRDLESYRDSLAADLTNEAGILSLLTAPAMSFDDQKVAERNLAALSEKPAVLTAALYRPDGKLYASYVRDGADPPDAVEAFEILRAIGRKQRDAIARCNAVVARQRGADGGGAPRERPVVGIEIEAGEQRRRLGSYPCGCRQPFGDVHRPPPEIVRRITSPAPAPIRSWPPPRRPC